MLDAAAQGVDAGGVAAERLPVVDQHQPRRATIARLPAQQLRHRRAFEQACRGQESYRGCQTSSILYTARDCLCPSRAHGLAGGVINCVLIFLPQGPDSNYDRTLMDQVKCSVNAPLTSSSLMAQPTGSEAGTARTAGLHPALY